MQSNNNNNKKTNRSLNKKEIFFILGFSLFFVYFFFLFKQIDFIQNNQVEFGILFDEIIGSYLLFVLLTYAVMVGTLLVLCYFFKNVYKYVILVLFGLELASYAQFLLFNDTTMINVNGHVSASIFQFIFNSLIYLLIWAVPTIAYILYARNVKNKKGQSAETENKKVENTNNNNNSTASSTSEITSTSKLYKVVIVAMAVIFGMQAVGMFTSISKYQKAVADDTLYYFSIDEQLKLSKNENIITFVLDRFDTSYTDEIFEKHPEDKEIFSGFTYYKDNISQYPSTFPSIAGMLTGETFDKQQSQKEFMEKAWDNPLLFNALKDNNYKITGLLNSIATFYEFSQVNDKFDNIKKLDKKNRDVKEFKFFTSVTSAALNQFMPYSLKELFTGYITIPNDCVKIKNTPDYFSKTVSPDSDLAIYDRLNEVGLTANEEENVFSFVHLLASHNPYGYNENLKKKNSNTISQTRGTFKILEEYFNQMKELGIYQDATIIVMADHGHWDMVNNMNKINNVPMASLFIKQSGQGTNIVDDDSTPLQINDTAQLYHANYIPTMIEILYSNNNAINQTYYDSVKAESKSYFDVVNGNGEQEREYYFVKWTNMNSTHYKHKYIINGNANDKENWVKAS